MHILLLNLYNCNPYNDLFTKYQNFYLCLKWGVKKSFCSFFFFALTEYSEYYVGFLYRRPIKQIPSTYNTLSKRASWEFAHTICTAIVS